MDNDFSIDIEEINRNLENAEVVTLFFPLLRKTLLLDLRYGDEYDPIVTIMPMVNSPAERMETIQKLRPNLAKPEKIVFIPWPKYASSLVRLGLYDSIKQRLTTIGRSKPLADLRSALKTLEQTEKDEIAAVIKGKGYRTLWQSGDK
jgi:phospholipid N-methyltransferase